MDKATFTAVLGSSLHCNEGSRLRTEPRFSPEDMHSASGRAVAWPVFDRELPWRQVFDERLQRSAKLRRRDADDAAEDGEEKAES